VFIIIIAITITFGSTVNLQNYEMLSNLMNSEFSSQYRRVLIIFPLMHQTISTEQMLSDRENVSDARILDITSRLIANFVLKFPILLPWQQQSV